MSLIEEALKKRQAAAAAGARRVPAAETGQPKEAGSPGPARRPLGDPQKIRRLNTDGLRADGLLPPESEAQLIAHQFRTIKRPLVRKAFQESTSDNTLMQRCIMVSSALPGDGKTFTSLNLALSLAMERDHSVILVDGDVAKPHISKLFSAGNEPGLLDVLEDPARSIASVILPTDVSGLSVVTVGTQSRQATELLASGRMRTVLRELESLDPQAIVVVDSPPILLTSEARVLASLFGQVVMVVRAGGTPQQAVFDAIKVLGESAHVSLVLNQALHVGDGSYYGYGAGYGYGDAPIQGSQT
jgi:protein-tyrosine kinase